MRGQGEEIGVGALLPTRFHLFPLVSDLFPALLGQKEEACTVELGRVLRCQGRGSGVRALLPTCFHLLPLVSDMVLSSRGLFCVARVGKAA